MQLRTFLARDMSSALAKVRREMGPEAVILSSEPTVDGGVLVRAALDSANAYDNVAFSDNAEPDVVDVPARPEEEAAVLAQLQAVCAAASGVVDAHGSGGVPARARQVGPPTGGGTSPRQGPSPDQKSRKVPSGEVHALRRRVPAAGVVRKFDRAALLEIFACHRLPDALAHQLAERAAESGRQDMTEALASALEEGMQVRPLDFSAARGLLLTGPCGVGKTATAAKMAAHAQLAGRDVCLIAADTEGAGAVERLAAFARHLQAECIAASSTAAAQRAVRRAQSKGALPIIDTPGCDPRQPMLTLGAAVRGVEIIGIVSAVTDSEEMGEITGAMRPCDIHRLVVTQTDMTRRYGAVVAAALSADLGLAFMTRSPFVADGLEMLSPHRLARLLIESKKESVP